MGHLYPIKTAFMWFPLIALVITLPYVLRQYHKYGSVNKFRTLIIYTFILYMLNVYFLVILPLPSFEYVANLTTPTMELVPFTPFIAFLKSNALNPTQPSTWITAFRVSSAYTSLFNIFMTIPFGMYLRYYFKCSLKKTMILSFFLSLFFELTQLSSLYGIYPRPYRLFDVDDLFTNTLGGVLGYYFVGGLMNLLPSRDQIDANTIKQGMIVSSNRKLLMFVLDMLTMSLLRAVLTHFIDNNYFYYGVFVVYFGLIPFLLNGTTLWGKFLNVKYEFGNKNSHQSYSYYVTLRFISYILTFHNSLLIC